MSPVGLVCPQCKQKLYTDPPRGRCLSFWESQPAAYSAEGEPCFVYTLVWDDFRIRSLHAPESQDDPRGRRIRLLAAAASQRELSTSSDDSTASDNTAPNFFWKNRLGDGPSSLRPPFMEGDVEDRSSFGDELDDLFGLDDPE